MITLALCGAHGTGKTTILNELAVELPNCTVIKDSVRGFWQQSGIEDFEKLPDDIRAEFQKHQILNQLKLEDSFKSTGFITDRSVADYWGYTVVSSNMSNPDLALYKELVKARLVTYTHVVFVPIMFEAKNEKLRANIDSRQHISDVIEDLLKETLDEKRFLRLEAINKQERIKSILSFLTAN